MKDFFNYNKYLDSKVLTIDKARTKGTLFHLENKGYPAMVEGEDWVYGELMTLKNYEDTMIALDEMEHFYGENNAKNEYNRVIKEVELLGTGKRIKAYTYVYNEESLADLNKNQILIPHGSWRDFMANMD